MQWAELVAARVMGSDALDQLHDQSWTGAESALLVEMMRALAEDVRAGLPGGRHYFIRLFKQSTGLSPHQHVLQKRVARAQALLGDPKLSLAEVALRAGFAHQSHFSQTFHRLTGMAPRQYRHALK